MKNDETLATLELSTLANVTGGSDTWSGVLGDVGNWAGGVAGAAIGGRIGGARGATVGAGIGQTAGGYAGRAIGGFFDGFRGGGDPADAQPWVYTAGA